MNNSWSHTEERASAEGHTDMLQRVSLPDAGRRLRTAERFSAEIARQLEAGEALHHEFEYRILLPDGRTHLKRDAGGPYRT